MIKSRSFNSPLIGNATYNNGQMLIAGETFGSLLLIKRNNYYNKRNQGVSATWWCELMRRSDVQLRNIPLTFTQSNMGERMFQKYILRGLKMI